jgi:hypothetical protein
MIGNVTHRVLVAVATAWTAFYLIIYLGLISQQGGPIAAWYVGLLIVGAVCLGAGIRSRLALVAGLVIDVAAALPAALTIGVLLLPAIVAAAIAVVRGKRVAGPAGGRRSFPGSRREGSRG